MTSSEQYADKQYIIDARIEHEVLEGRWGKLLNAPHKGGLKKFARSELESLYKELANAKTLQAANQMIAKAIAASETARRAAEAAKDAHIGPATISMEL